MHTYGRQVKTLYIASPAQGINSLAKECKQRHTCSHICCLYSMFSHFKGYLFTAYCWTTV